MVAFMVGTKKFSRLSLIVLIALLYVICYNSALIGYRFELHKAAYGLALLEAGEEMLYAIALTVAFFYAITFNTVLFAFTSVVIFVTGALASYFVASYHITLDAQAIALLVETTPAEMRAFITAPLLLWLFFACILAAFSIWLLHRFERTDPHDAKLCFIAGLFAASILLFDCDGIGSKYLPYNYLTETANYVLKRASQKQIKDISHYPASLHSASSQPLTVVLIIGESARADHFHSNGYLRQTTPLLEKIPNMIGFKDVYSCAILTRDSVPCMLTRATIKNREPAYTETSFISVFKKLGFHTAWLGTQGTYSAIDSPYTRLTKEADNVVFLDTDLYSTYALDENLFPFFDSYLKENAGNKLVILHTFGSHWHYESRYPDRFRLFKPICSKKLWTRDMTHCSNEELVNSYDNTILYTDYIISSTIEKLKGTNALVTYISDHGESLGENGMYLHGMKSTKEQRYVPMFWWASDSFIASNPQKFAHIKQHKDKPLSHDNLFHSMLDCAGITSEVVDKTLSICN